MSDTSAGAQHACPPFVKNEEFFAEIGCAKPAMTAGGIIGGPCGHVVGKTLLCKVCGFACAVGGTIIGAIILCGACYAGKKYGKLPWNKKVIVVVVSIVGGAFVGGGVAKLVTLGAGVVASTPAMLVGATVGVVIVGGTAAFGHLAESADKELTEVKRQLTRMEEAHQKETEALKTDLNAVKTELTDVKTMLKEERKEKEALKTELTAVKTELTGVKGQLSRMEKENKELKTELTGVKGQLSRMETMLKEERKEKEALKGKLSRIETTMQQILANQQQNGNAQ